MSLRGRAGESIRFEVVRGLGLELDMTDRRDREVAVDFQQSLMS